MEKILGEMPLVVCIAGPTASGKSAYAVDIAKAVGGEIINADALQVYVDLHWLSARPTEADMAGVPHHLFGYVSGDTLYSTGDWVRDVVPVILQVMGRNRIPIIVGGTGMYFRALLEGLANVPPVPRDIASAVDLIPISEMRRQAEEIDPAASSRVLGDDPQRLARIIGVHRATGRALSSWQDDTRPIIPAQFTRRSVLLPDRVSLYARINQRFDQMLEAGGLEEAQTVHALGYPARAPMLKAIGLSHLLSYLDGECDLENAIETAKRDTRRLAKRQMTWFRNRCTDWTVLKNEAEKEIYAQSL
ncbi:tRNA (adenosine(37)-N6)-dimethylallyltransferase MiaA [Algimonas arctica]|nr:tRNA (adenosine(37)-N6)-dimethylallyltransferase MiaA [Algimonas arctica]